MELFRLLGTIAVENSAANKAIDETTTKAHGSGEKIGNSFTRIGEKSIELGNKMKWVSAGAATLLGTMVKSAADVKAMNAQFEQTFAGVEDKASAAMQRVASASGIMETRLKGVGTQMFAFAKTTGMETPEALNLMERALTVTADSAAYYDRSIEEVSENLQSFLKGNYENDAALGLSCTETTRNAAANKLYGKSFMELSEAQKQMVLLQMVEDANKLSGAMGQAARESDGWENVIGNLKESLRQLAASIGSVILPTVVKITQGITAAINKFSEMGDGTKKIIVAVVATVAAASPVLTVFGKIMTTGGKMISTFNKVSKTITGSMAAVNKYSMALNKTAIAYNVANGNLTKQQAIIGTLGNKIKVLSKITIKDTAASVANAVSKSRVGTAASNAATKSLAFARSTLKSTVTTISDTAANTVNAVSKSRVGTAASGAAKKVIAFASANKVAILAALGLAAPIIALAAYMMTTGASADEVAAKITGFADKLAGMITSFANQFPSMVNSFVNSFTQVLNAITAQLPVLIPALANAGVQLFMGLVQSLNQIIVPVINALTQVITQVVAMIPVLIPMLVSAGVQLFMGLVQAIPQVITALVGALPQIVSAIAQAIPVLIPAILQAGVTLLMALVDAIPQIITALVEALPQIITAIVNTLITLIPALQQASIQLFMALVQAIPQIIPPLLAAIPQIIVALMNGLATGLQAVWNAVKAGASAAWEGIKSLAAEKWNSIKEKIMQPIEIARQKVNSGIEKIKSYFNFDAVISKVKSKWDSIKNRIVDPIETAKQKVQSALNKIKGMFPLSIGKIFSNLKLPHISVDGGKAPFGIGGKGSLPSFHVNWNAKGAIFDEPTIFATAKGLQGVGEAGAEAVTPIDTLKTYVREAVASENVMQEDLMRRMIDSNNQTNQLLNSILQMLSNQKIEWNDRELGRFVKNYAR